MAVMDLGSSLPDLHVLGEKLRVEAFLSKETLDRLGSLENVFDCVVLDAAEERRAIVLVNNPDAVHHVLVRNHRNYVKGPEFARIKMLTGAGLIVSDGQKWRRSRRMVQPAFGRASLDIFEAAVSDEIERLLARWSALASSGAVCDLSRDIEAFSLNIMMQSIFSRDMDALGHRSETSPFLVLVDHEAKNLELAVKVRHLRRSVLELIRARRKSTGRQAEDLLAVLMTARDRDGSALSDEELADEAMTLIVAGFETSAIVLSWMWYFSGLDPAIHKGLVAQNRDDDPGAYSFMLMREVLRLYPPVWMFSRSACDADRIGDVDIPVGTIVAVSPYFLHRRADVWDDPLRFDPNRFDGFQKRDQRNRAYIPFSGGPRRCIGDGFAEIEAVRMFTRIAPKLRLSPLPGHTPSLEPKINLRATPRIKMRIETT